jgi:hypothetical protein
LMTGQPAILEIIEILIRAHYRLFSGEVRF